ncbi:hypothetical protein DERP_008090, partial [Dermatophagoides pteronyssinus]
VYCNMLTSSYVLDTSILPLDLFFLCCRCIYYRYCCQVIDVLESWINNIANVMKQTDYLVDKIFH